MVRTSPTASPFSLVTTFNGPSNLKMQSQRFGFSLIGKNIRNLCVLNYREMWQIEKVSPPHVHSNVKQTLVSVHLPSKKHICKSRHDKHCFLDSRIFFSTSIFRRFFLHIINIAEIIYGVNSCYGWGGGGEGKSQFAEVRKVSVHPHPYSPSLHTNLEINSAL